MAAVRYLAVLQPKRAQVDHVLGGVVGGLLGEAVGRLWPLRPSQLAGLPAVVQRLAGDVDRRVRCRGLAGVVDERLDFGVGGSIREDIDLHLDRSGLAILGDLLVE